MKNEITTLHGAALWTLANNLRHEWAGYTTAEEMLADGWAAVAARVTAAMEASHDEMSESQHSLPEGLWPGTSHTTGSGRISWLCRSYGEGRSLRSVIQLEVRRPAPGLHGGNSVVLRLTAQLDDEGGWILADCESAPSMIELRHLQALSYALYESEDECYLRHIMDHIGDVELVERLEPDIAVAQARLVAYALQKGAVGQ